jgi:ParB-like chromosome segregation protein Spo0J
VTTPTTDTGTTKPKPPVRLRPSEVILFYGDDILFLPVTPQVGRWGDLNQAHIQYLAREIARDGQTQPCHIRKGPSGPELVTGRHRRAAVLEINESLGREGGSPYLTALGTPISDPIPLKCLYANVTEDRAVKLAFQENTGLPLTVVDLAHAASTLRSLYPDWSNAQIADVISTPHHPVSPVRVSQFYALMTLPTHILSSIHRGEMSEGVARAMLKMKLERETIQDIANKLKAGTLKSGDLIEMSNEVQRRKGVKVRRSIVDIEKLMEKVDSDKGWNFLGWLRGEHNDTEVVAGIFADEEG